MHAPDPRARAAAHQNVNRAVFMENRFAPPGVRVDDVALASDGVQPVKLWPPQIVLIQRSHDMNMSGWWSLAALIPIVGLVWVFKGGTAGTNRWGAPPPPNGPMVKIFGLLMPVLFVVGILAAIALPAYQGYVTRAKAAAPQ